MREREEARSGKSKDEKKPANGKAAAPAAPGAQSTPESAPAAPAEAPASTTEAPAAPGPDEPKPAN